MPSTPSWDQGISERHTVLDRLEHEGLSSSPRPTPHPEGSTRVPNMPNLPSAADLAAEGRQRTREAYGRHATVSVTSDGATLRSLADEVLVHVGANDSPSVDLKSVGTDTVPYVNAFLKGTGLKVERYWRTKAYRLVGATAPKPAPVAAPKPAPRPVEPRPVVAVVADDTIPGLERPAPIKPKSLGHGLVSLGGITLPETDLHTLQDAWDLRQSDVPAAVLITGPAGTAKTMLVKAFAASIGVEYLKVDAGAVRTADDWAGAFRQDPETKTWSHRWSPFARALRRGIPMVILIDELTRTESPQALNALTGLLDWTKTLLVPDANEVLTLPAGVLVVATANIGPEFTGSLPLDGAIRQRFPHGIRMGYPAEAKTEADIVTSMTGLDTVEAERLVRFAELQRANRDDPQQYPSGGVVSTRMLIDIARRITAKGRDPREAVMASLAAQFDAGDFPALNIIVDSQFPVEVVIEDDKVKEIDPDTLIAAATKAANDQGKYLPAGQVICQAANRNGSAVNGNGSAVCGNPYMVTRDSCPACGTPNPIKASLAAAAAAALPKPLITVAKHYFLKRSQLTGELTTQCQYRPDPTQPATCNRERAHAIHH